MPTIPSKATLLSRRVVTSLERRGLYHVLEPICLSYATTIEDVCGPSRTQNVARARHAIWWFLRHREGSAFSYTEIGSLFERDHTSVMAGVRTHRLRMEEAARSAEGASSAPVDACSVTAGICAA